MKIVFLSGCDAALPALRTLQAKGHSLSLLCPTDAEGRSAQSEIETLEAWAAEYGIPCWQVSAHALESELRELVQETTPHLVLSFGFSAPVSGPLLESVRYGGWNIHFSLSPAQRPSTHLEGAISLQEWRGDHCSDLLLQRHCSIPVDHNHPLEELGVQAAQLLEEALLRMTGLSFGLGWRLGASAML